MDLVKDSKLGTFIIAVANPIIYDNKLRGSSTLNLLLRVELQHTVFNRNGTLTQTTSNES